MNSVFWIGIGIGFVLSLIASMVANIYNEKIPLLLRGKLISKRRCRKKLGQDYKLVSEPYSDKRDKYLYIACLWNLVTYWFIFAAIRTPSRIARAFPTLRPGKA
jgi:hypothetical protein